MKTPFVQLGSPPQRMLGIPVVLAVVAGLSGLFDSTTNDGTATARPRDSNSLFATWTAPALTHEGEPATQQKARCAGCGVIETSSETETPGDDGGSGSVSSGTPGTLSTRRWITVRFAGGSRHVIDDVSPAQWRPRERVIVVGGPAAER